MVVLEIFLAHTRDLKIPRDRRIPVQPNPDIVDPYRNRIGPGRPLARHLGRTYFSHSASAYRVGRRHRLSPCIPLYGVSEARVFL